MIEFLYYIEIPVHVTVELNKEEKATRHYPGYPAHAEIQTVEILLPDEKTKATIKNLEDWVLENEDLEVEAWEHR